MPLLAPISLAYFVLRYYIDLSNLTLATTSLALSPERDLAHVTVPPARLTDTDFDLPLFDKVSVCHNDIQIQKLEPLGLEQGALFAALVFAAALVSAVFASLIGHWYLAVVIFGIVTTVVTCAYIYTRHVRTRILGVVVMAAVGQSRSDYKQESVRFLPIFFFGNFTARQKLRHRSRGANATRMWRMPRQHSSIHSSVVQVRRALHRLVK